MITIRDELPVFVLVHVDEDTRGVEWRDEANALHVHHAPTFHAALIAACKAVQEAGS